MIVGLGSAMLRDHPDIPAIPIHDCLLCPEWAEPTIAEAIRREWRGQAGVEVPLKVQRPA
jgi:hypothetical protein